jgi:tRNA-dihydrouridine synthase A
MNLQPEPQPAYRLTIAPMMDVTDRHCRTLHRLLAPDALLFTEMVHAGALARGGRLDLLRHGRQPAPVACQLGGCDPEQLATATGIAIAAGYDEVNLNVGCPSERVQHGAFGACLMAEPDLVADCVRAMKRATEATISVKCRLGIDDLDSQPLLERFVATLVDAGCDRLYLHARKAILKGLSPAQNRSVPPLQPERVFALKRAFPALPVIINGGIDSPGRAREGLTGADGVMIGRAAWHRPELLLELQTLAFGRAPTLDHALDGWLAYLTDELAAGEPLARLVRPMLGLFAGRPGARAFRPQLSDHRALATNRDEVVHEALAHISACAA